MRAFDKIHVKDALAFGFYLASVFTFELIADEIIGVGGNINAVRPTRTFDPGSHIDRITPNVKRILPRSNDASNNRAGMNADP